jgi:MYXO-CTERM domain-containing protein
MNRVLAAGLIAFALLFAVSHMVGYEAGQTPRVLAQAETPVATTSAQPAPTTQPAQRVDDDNDFPWGLLGLLGLAGLAGLRRPAEPVRRQTERVEPTVGVYDNPKR